MGSRTPAAGLWTAFPRCTSPELYAVNPPEYDTHPNETVFLPDTVGFGDPAIHELVLKRVSPHSTAVTTRDGGAEGLVEEMNRSIPQCGEGHATIDAGAATAVRLEHPPSESKHLGAIQTVNNFYGTVNNIRNVESGYFRDNYAARIRHEYRYWAPPPIRIGDNETSRDTLSKPPHPFVTFGSAFIRCHGWSQPNGVADEDLADIVDTTWSHLSQDDQRRIIDEAERAEELHMAMEGSKGKGMRGEIQEKKYWQFSGRITDFWYEKWKEVQVVVTAHLKQIGKLLLLTPGMSSDAEHKHNPLPQNRSPASKLRLSHDPRRDSPHKPGTVQRLFGRFRKKTSDRVNKTDPTAGVVTAL